MRVCERIADLRSEVAALRRAGRSVEFVPTMGAFHEGHLSLMRAARGGGGAVVVSVFVNPLQFGPAEDFDAYPRDLDGDLAQAGREGVDLVFAPPDAEMYPDGGLETRIEVGRLGEILEGAHRPGHFAGVATVCAKLFSIVVPDRVWLGQKDAQQVAVLRRMVSDLNLPLELAIGPTVREPDGLAMSSRNQRLNQADRRAAAALPAALRAAAGVAAGGGSVEQVIAAGRRVLDEQPRVRVQYLEVVHPSSFAPVREAVRGTLIVVAAHVGPVRLIDNWVVGTVATA